MDLSSSLGLSLATCEAMEPLGLLVPGVLNRFLAGADEEGLLERFGREASS